MGKKSFNFGGLASKALDIVLHPAIVIPGIIATFVGGLASLAIWIEAPSQEEVLTEQFQNEILTTVEDGKIYSLISEDVIRVQESNLHLDFHFSSGDIYIQTAPQKHFPEGEDAVFSSLSLKSFNEIARPEWVNEVREIGCEIAKQPIIFEGEETIAGRIELARQSAAGFLELHCGGE